MDTILFHIVIDPFIHYGFLQRAFIAGVFIASACAILGVFLILRRESMIGHGLAHISFAGIALGLFLNILPLAVALLVAMGLAVLIMVIKERAGVYGDTAIAIFSSLGLAVGIILASLARSFNVDLFGYLFGEILAIGLAEVLLSIILAALVIFLVIMQYHKFLYITFDSESAKVAGIKVKRIDMFITVLTAVTIVLGMKVVGILLVSALVVIPAAAGLQAAGSFKQAIWFSSGVAVFSVISGLFLSYYLDLPASGTIVVMNFLVFGLFFGCKYLK
jgi:zinc transport system permease protein